MGSTGSGTFGNYHPSGLRGGMGDGVGGAGGAIGGDTEYGCPDVVDNINLEDVASSEYYTNHLSLPAGNLGVQLRSQLHGRRMVVELIDTGEILGNLPTRYHELLLCMKKGIHYTGEVISSGPSPIPFIVVRLHA